MITANGRSWRRISSGSSTAAKSARSATPSADTRRTVTERLPSNIGNAQGPHERRLLLPTRLSPVILETLVREHALDEILTQFRIHKPPFLFNGEKWKPCHQRGRKQAAAVTNRNSLHKGLDAFHAAARGIPLQDVPRKILRTELLQTPRRPLVHRVGVVHIRPGRDHAQGSVVAHQVERLARDAEAHLDFRTN